MDFITQKIPSIDDLFTIKGKKGIFTILLTATILTIFEMVFFYQIVVPTVEHEMDSNIESISRKIAANINEKNEAVQKKNVLADIAVSQSTSVVFNDISGGVLKTFAKREKELIDDINRYTIYTGVVLLVTMAILLYFIFYSIRTDVRLDLDDTIDDDNMAEAALTALFTVGVLIAFQILFYFFGRQYKYPGTLGSEELTWEVIDAINTDQAIQQQVADQMALKNVKSESQR